MKVNVSVVGRFHAFDLAKVLSNKGVLNKLITTYPKFKANEWDISSSDIVSSVHLELLNRIKHRVPFVSNDKINFLVKRLHDEKSSKYTHEADICIGWSGSSLYSILQAKKRNKIFILERGSAHYSCTVNLLRKEYSEQNLEYQVNIEQWKQELLEYELADYISIPSSFVKRSFVDYGVPESKLIVNPYGVDLTNFKRVEKNDHVFRVIFCGNLSIMKGSHYLLQAFSELNLDGSELWHIGSISKEMIPFIKKYSSKNIIYKGSYPQSSLYELYSQGSVFVLPSVQEGFGMVILQAMSCGLPIIASENTGAEDLVTKQGEEGYIVPIRNVAEIKKYILELYHNPELLKMMGEKARDRVVNGFSWEDYGERYVENLKCIANNHSN